MAVRAFPHTHTHTYDATCTHTDHVTHECTFADVAAEGRGYFQGARRTIEYPALLLISVHSLVSPFLLLAAFFLNNRVLSLFLLCSHSLTCLSLVSFFFFFLFRKLLFLFAKYLPTRFSYWRCCILPAFCLHLPLANY